MPVCTPVAKAHRFEPVRWVGQWLSQRCSTRANVAQPISGIYSSDIDASSILGCEHIRDQLTPQESPFAGTNNSGGGCGSGSSVFPVL